MNSSSSNSKRVGIIGGGIAGSTIALKLSALDIDVVLFEAGKSLVNGPPVCHLHAGGNLYPDISDEQCLTLLSQSIATIKVYPDCINRRPTIIANPKRYSGDINSILPRLQLLQKCYEQLISDDPSNAVLGEPQDYFQLCERDYLESLIGKKQTSSVTTLEQWLIPFANNVDLNTIKFPILIVQEYGLSLFRIAATSSLALNAKPNCQLLISTKVTNVQLSKEKWIITYSKGGKTSKVEVDYLINACGYQTGFIDNLTQFQKTRMVEFKAAYVTHWQQGDKWPEVIFHGERSTPNGMAQLTPYPDGYFQLHGMTEEITLFKDGLAKSTSDSAQPILNQHINTKLQQGWSVEESQARTHKAIAHIAYFIPTFNTAKHSSTPLFGAQQVPGEDISLRAYDVSFEKQHYARAEIVKASSALTVAEQIIDKLKLNDFKIDTSLLNSALITSIDSNDIDVLAQQIAAERQYPKSLAKI